MSYAAANARFRRNAWTEDPEAVVAFARDLIRVGVLQGSTGVLEYFEKPQGWSREHEWWTEHGCSDDPDVWAQAGWL